MTQRRHHDAPALVCAACGQPITDPDARISVDGRHDHRCVNPSGVIYDIGCFARAPGALPSGAPSRYFSWFRGHSWRIVQCRGCATHLGWHFCRDDATFFGLILARLALGGRPDSADA